MYKVIDIIAEHLGGIFALGVLACLTYLNVSEFIRKKRQP